jgi:SAM-dependent methyltransferase
MLLYGLTIFISAFLLFQIQPIVAKLILPWFGGAAAVWSACLLFFQVVLLLGYLYAHLLVRRLRPKSQFFVHIAALAVSLLALHVIPYPGLKPAGGEDPVLRIVVLLAACVGLPYMLLASTGPLLQAWYARTHHVAFPYRLFAVSNLGCLLALLTYPVLVEPLVAASHQARIWSISYVAFCLLCGVAAWRSRRVSPPPPEADGDATVVEEHPSRSSYVLWLALTACSSTLLLAITNYVSQNIASVPFLWILPLSLYLLSFVLTFERDRWYRPGIYIGLLALSLSGMTYGLAKFDGSTDIKRVIPLFAGAFFVCCMFCHGELARRRPHSRYLTGYYLTIAIGGALGGVFVGGLAPRIFRGFFELPVAIFACAVLGIITFRGLYKYLQVCWAVLTLVLGYTLWTQERLVVKGAILMVRNFYGSIRVTQDGKLDDPYATRTLVNGTITHGLQYLAADRRRLPTTYYGHQTGVGMAIENTRRSAQRVGVIGLGAGTIAAYGRPDDYYRFYDINPRVIEIARRQFSYLIDCPAKVDVVLGDARLSLEREPNQNFDVLAVDAFSSDSIPVHLLTLEAFRLFFRHVRPDGILAVHVSNRHLDLEPVVERLATALGKQNILVDSDDGEDLVYGASWVLVASQPDVLRQPALAAAGRPVVPKRGLRMWTDDYSNLIQILK